VIRERPLFVDYLDILPPLKGAELDRATALFEAMREIARKSKVKIVTAKSPWPWPWYPDRQSS